MVKMVIKVNEPSGIREEQILPKYKVKDPFAGVQLNPQREMMRQTSTDSARMAHKVAEEKAKLADNAIADKHLIHSHKG